jgi:hypothetical protein
MTHATQLDRIAELVQHELSPGETLSCRLDPKDGSTVLTLRSGGSTLCVHLSTKCEASFKGLGDAAAKARLRQLFDDLSEGD